LKSKWPFRLKALELLDLLLSLDKSRGKFKIMAVQKFYKKTENIDFSESLPVYKRAKKPIGIQLFANSLL